MKWRFEGFEPADLLFSEHVEEDPLLLVLAPEAEAVAEGSATEEPGPEPESAEVEDVAEPPDAGDAGEGVGTFVPEGKGGVAVAAATICAFVPARLATGPPGKV